jgi:histidine triad (HIT) family protein
MTTLFSKIINGDIPGTFVHKDEHCVVFMTINPISDGHVLVVPILEVDHWVDLPHDTSAHVFAVAQKIAKALEAAFPCERIGLIIAGYEINHCHLHLIPTNSLADFNFANAATSVERSTLEEHAARITAVLQNI